MSDTQKFSIRDYMITHEPQDCMASEMILGLDDLLVYEVIRDGKEIGTPIVYMCTPNLKSIYSNTNGVPVCPNCHKTAYNTNAYRIRDLTDIPQDNRRVVLRILFKTYECPNCGSINTPPLQCAAGKYKVTNRLLDAIAENCFSRRRTFSELAEHYHVSDTLVHKVFNTEAGKRSAETLYSAMPHLCIDEVLIHTKKSRNANNAKPGKKESGTLCVSILATDLNGGDKSLPNQAVVAFEYPEKRDIPHIVEILNKLDHPEIVETFTMDMNVAYREAVRGVLPNCRIIVDRYHLVQSLNEKTQKVAHALYYQKRNEAREKLKQLISSETIALSDEIDKNDELTAIDSLFDDERRKVYKEKLSGITVNTDAQREAKEELQFLADNYYNRWFCMNPDSFSDTAKVKLLRLFKKHPEFEELYKWKEVLRFNFFEAETADEAHEIADKMEAEIPKTRIYRPLRTYIKTLNDEKSGWKDYIFDYFTEPKGHRYSNAAMEEFNRDVKEINRIAKGVTPEVLLYKTLFGDVVYRKKEKHLTREDLDNMLHTRFALYTTGFPGYMYSLPMIINVSEYSRIAYTCGIISSSRTLPPELVFHERCRCDISYERWEAFLDALIESENSQEPAVKLYDSYPVFKPFPVANGAELSDPIAFTVLAEDVESLNKNIFKTDIINGDYSMLENPIFENFVWIPTGFDERTI